MDEDLATLDAIFEEHLAAATATRARSCRPSPSWPASICDCARRWRQAPRLRQRRQRRRRAALRGRAGGSLPPATTRPAGHGPDSQTRRPLTAIANDFSYDEVFERQVEALCGPATWSSASAPAAARSPWPAACGGTPARRADLGAHRAAGGRTSGEAAEHVLRVPSDVTARIQEMHITVIHAVSELVDAGPPKRRPAGRT